jgi:ubiquinone/menaquinone biosynthesis C-methylase UbiE
VTLSGFGQRSLELERLDRGEYTAAEYALWQREMRFINRWLGDKRALKRRLGRRLRAGDDLRILDVGAGFGELLKVCSELTDVTAGHVYVGVDTSQTACSVMSSRPDVKIDPIVADALQLPFADHSFDIVISSLFLHHLTDEEAARLLAESARVSRSLVLMIDLNRHRAAYVLYRVFAAAFLQPFTAQDGALSIRRGFRPDELIEIARRAGLSKASIRRSMPFRLVLEASVDQ